MIRFIDLTNQIQEGKKMFAFFDTVTNKFVEIGNTQTWEQRGDFEEDVRQHLPSHVSVIRCLSLIPKDWPFPNEEPSPTLI